MTVALYLRLATDLYRFGKVSVFRRQLEQASFAALALVLQHPEFALRTLYNTAKAMENDMKQVVSLVRFAGTRLCPESQ